jgi:type IV pilus assembly protein PilA
MSLFARPRRSAAILLVLAAVVPLSGCSDTKPPPQSAKSGDAETARTDVSAQPGAAGSGAPAVRTAAQAGSVMVAVRADMMHAGFLDLKKLRDRGWFKLLETLPADVGQPVRDLVKQCGTEPWGAVDELAWSGATDKALVVVAKLNVSPDVAMTCIKNVSGRASEVTVGADKGLKVGGMTVVAHQGMLVLGLGKPFEDVLADVPAGNAPLAAKVAISADQALRIAVDASSLPGAPVREVLATLTTSATRFAIEAEVRATNEGAAQELEGQAKGMLDKLGALGKDAPALPPIKVSRDGALVGIVLEKLGGAEEQVAMLGTLSALSIYGVRRYVQSSKTAEAKNTIFAIARGMVAYVERENVDAKGKLLPHLCPPNAAAVPKDVPAGKKYMSSESDWSGTWKDLRFMMSSPQYYRYRVETSANRKKCTAIAEGDLDGNGKLSKFSVSVEIDAKGAVKMGKDITVENEFE